MHGERDVCPSPALKPPEGWGQGFPDLPAREAPFPIGPDFHLQHVKCGYFKGCKSGSDRDVGRTEDIAEMAERTLNPAHLVNGRVNA